MGVCAISLHFSILLGRDLWHYFALDGLAPARVLQWEIVPLKEKFGLKASYGFELQDKTWLGSSVLEPPLYLNEFAALSGLKEKAKEPRNAWYKTGDPAISALEKKFPLNLLIRSLICYGVLIYFFSLYKRLSLV